MNEHERAYLRMLLARPKYADAIAQEFSVKPRGFWITSAGAGTIMHSAEVERFCAELEREWRGR